MKSLYLLVNFFTIIIPLIFSFHPKLNFYKTWKAFFPAVVVTGIGFVIWDAYFTRLGVWGFNENYISGLWIFGLPLEEVLFFLCIPYACVFTFYCLDKFWAEPFSKKTESIITGILCLFLIIGSFVYKEQIYTLWTFASLALILAFSSFVLKIPWLGKFYVVYSILLLPFMIVNGVLTGTGIPEPVVWYNADEHIGLRILTIPVEDVFYGLELILINLLIYRAIMNRVRKTYAEEKLPIKNTVRTKQVIHE